MEDQLPKDVRPIISIYESSMNRTLKQWNEFLNTTYETDEEDDPIRMCDWVETIVQGTILPAILENGYVLSIHPSILSTCILNTLFRHVQDYKKGERTSYQCSHAHTSTTIFYKQYAKHIEDTIHPNPLPARLGQLEFFMIRKFPEEFWNSMRKAYPVNWPDDFADRVWADLPYIVLWHISHERSAATQELEDMNRHLDEEEDNDSPYDE